MYEEIGLMLEQAFDNALRKSKLFQAHRKVLRKFLDAMKLEIQAFEGQEDSAEELLKSVEELTSIARERRILLSVFPD